MLYDSAIRPATLGVLKRLMLIPELCSFNSETPVCFRGQTWESVQAFIQKKVRDFLI
jgi:hypothetical protein